VCLVAALSVAGPARAQSPNTAALVILVTDSSGGAVPDALIHLTNSRIGLTRQAATGTEGSATIAALPVAGTYALTVAKAGFGTEQNEVTLRAGETATVRVVLRVGTEASTVTVYGTTSGVSAAPGLGLRLDPGAIDERPILGRKITSLPLQHSAFRSAKGTGDLFINATFFVTGTGGRRSPAVAVDGATNDDLWGRQTMLATVPVAAVQEMNVLSSAFSSEFGWTSSAAVNIVTRSGSNELRGDVLFLGRPGAWQAEDLGTSGHCPGSIPTCVPPVSGGATRPLLPPDIPDALAQGSFALGGPLVRDRTHFFAVVEGTSQDRTSPLTTPLVAEGSVYRGKYRQALADVRVDHTLSDAHRVMARVNVDRFSDSNPNDVISGNTLPSAGRTFVRHTWSAQVNETAILGPQMLNEARFVYLDGNPITTFDPITASTQFTRAGSAPFTLGESRAVHAFSRQAQFSDTLSWTTGRHYLKLGGSLAHARSGGDGTEFGGPFVLGQFTVLSTTTAPPEALTLADMQTYTQGFDFGIREYENRQWLVALFAQDSYRVRNDLTLDLGLRYDRQTFTDSTANLAPRAGFGWNPGGRADTAVRGGYAMYYPMIRANTAAGFTLNGPLGVGSYSASPGQTGFPECLTCTPVVFDPSAAATTLPPRNVTVRAGRREYYTRVFEPFGVDFAELPGYPDSLDNPRSQVATIGVEREIGGGFTASADYVHQHVGRLDRSVDLNAPAPFDRSTAGQVRSPAAADLTRPIVPVNGGFRQINVVMNLGEADYDGLQALVRYTGVRRLEASVSYTLSKATNTTEPDGNGVGPNDANIARLGEEERGPSLLDQRHRAVVTVSYQWPAGCTVGTVAQFASARPINATTGVDNNGDRANNDRPVIDGRVTPKLSFRGSAQADVSLFAEGELPVAAGRLRLRAEVFNLFNHANVLGRNATWGNGSTPLPTFGLANAGLANIDPPRMVQVQLRYAF
jgi:outer membrane receptor protein involved in Fe transport